MNAHLVHARPISLRVWMYVDVRVCVRARAHACSTWCCLTMPNLMEVKRSRKNHWPVPHIYLPA